MKSFLTLLASTIVTMSSSAFAGSTLDLSGDVAKSLYSDVEALAKADSKNILCISFGAVTSFGTSCPLKAIYCSKNSKNAWAQVKDGSFQALATSAAAVCGALEANKVKLEGDSNGAQFRVMRNVASSSTGSRPMNSTVTTTTFSASGTVEQIQDLPSRDDDATRPESIVAELRAEGYKYMMPHTPENFVSTRLLVLSSGAVKRIAKDGTASAKTEIVATLGTKIMSNIRSLALRLDSTSQIQSKFSQAPAACYGGEPTVSLLLTDSANAAHAAMQHVTCKELTVDSVGIDAGNERKYLNKVGNAIKQLYDFLGMTAGDVAAVRE